MRHSMRALLGVLLVGCCCGQAIAAETGAKWWHFGQRKEADATASPETAPGADAATSAIADQQTSTSAYPNSEYPSAGLPERNWMISSPLAKVSWPRVHMPEMPKPKLPTSPWDKKSEADPTRNSWVESPVDPLKPSPMQSVSNGARRVGQSTRAAWDKTIDAVTPGDQSKASGSSSRVARREPRPPVWKRMFGAGDPRKVEGPQTVTEWMAQDRLDP